MLLDKNISNLSKPSKYMYLGAGLVGCFFFFFFFFHFFD